MLLLGIMGYVFAGYVYASSRISAAAGAINTLDSRRSYVNTTFDLLEQQASTLGTQSDGSVGEETWEAIRRVGRARSSGSPTPQPCWQQRWSRPSAAEVQHQDREHRPHHHCRQQRPVAEQQILRRGPHVPFAHQE